MQAHITATAGMPPVSVSYGAPGVLALFAAHCAGMVDLVGLPVWVGALIGHYRFDAQQAGTLVTLFLAGAVCSSLLLSPRIHRLPVRLVAAAGFGVAASAFFLASQTQAFLALAMLHATAGMAAGAGLSMAHGTMGRSSNPHKLFAYASLALGVFAIGFLGAVPVLIAQAGGAALFLVLAGIMAVAAVLCSLCFPKLPSSPQTGQAQARLERTVWFGMLGVGCMGLSQAMVFAFVQRIGIDNGFSESAVTGVLIALGLVNLAPAPLAALLQKRIGARSVVLAGPVVQAALALTITHSTSFAPYAAATAVFAAVMIFTHTFAFGLLARLDATGRAVAATPAMLMTGAAIGPILGGALVKHLGYGSAGLAVCGMAAMAVLCFSRTPVEQKS
ncbi:MFS transporter [Delftia sp. PS-11]|uniref:MFS transporter n=1 Tax=Delftia sp. PS-11 TaxID=2767222 RepID=UPI0024546DDE|nr:MFS transporter [Delftia sp. PS-11]